MADLQYKKEHHLEYLKRKGQFIVDVNPAIFSNEELTILKKYGNWFKGLCEGILPPFTKKQEYFIQVCKGKATPVSVGERAWKKYLDRKKYDRTEGKRNKYKFTYNLSLEDDQLDDEIHEPFEYYEKKKDYLK